MVARKPDKVAVQNRVPAHLEPAGVASQEKKSRGGKSKEVVNAKEDNNGEWKEF